MTDEDLLTGGVLYTDNNKYDFNFINKTNRLCILYYSIRKPKYLKFRTASRNFAIWKI